MLAREGPHQDKHTLGCPRLGRPAKASSNAMETEEEQHVEIGKARVEIKVKTIKVIDCFVF